MPTTRTFTFPQVVLIVILAMALVFGGFLIGQSTSADASGSPKTYYACLAKGNLTKVGTRHPTCSGRGAKVISWNQVGPAGSSGSQGAPGAPGASGAGMDYLAGTVDTSLATTVTFTTALSDSNYAVTLTPTGSSVQCAPANKTASGFDVTCFQIVENFEAAYFCVPYSILNQCGYTDSFPAWRPVGWAGVVNWMVVPNKNS